MVEHCPHFRFKDTTKNPICKRFFAKTYQKPLSRLEDKTFCAVKTKNGPDFSRIRCLNLGNKTYNLSVII